MGALLWSATIRKLQTIFCALIPLFRFFLCVLVLVLVPVLFYGGWSIVGDVLTVE